MARGGVEQPPFHAVRALTLYAGQHWGYLRGKLLLAGAPTSGYSMRDVIDMAYAALSDGINGLVVGDDVRAKVDEALRNSWIDRETWGTDADALDAIPTATPRTEA